MQTIDSMADQCVKCGLCLPHCPTYRVAGIEGESPRGRIALLQGLDSGRFDVTDSARMHLDNCLGCRACEPVCPARVPYGALIDAGRKLLPTSSPPMLGWISRHPDATRLMLRALGLFRRFGMHRLGPRSATAAPSWFWRSLRRLPLPPASDGLQSVYEPAGDACGDVTLFRGCVSHSMDRATLVTAARVLARLGYRVHVPDEQGCCGALDQHDGREERATRLAISNVAAFGEVSDDRPILTTATGCAATLLDYDRLTDGRGAAFAARTQDICAFILEHLDGLEDQLRPQPVRVALHQPCTARNVTGSAAAAKGLLSRIPELEMCTLDTGFGCCGAAGHHFLSRPDQADALLAPLLDEIREFGPDFVATTNIGCALHLGGGLAGEPQPAHPSPAVIHPIVLVASSLGLAD